MFFFVCFCVDKRFHCSYHENVIKIYRTNSICFEKSISKETKNEKEEK